MKLITRDTDYAIRAFCCMAGSPGTRFTVSDLAGELDIPGPFLRKILQILNKGKFLKSFKGKNGGFAIERSPREVTILDIVELLQGPFHISEHVFKGKNCPEIKTCLLKSRLDVIEKDMKEALRAITVDSLLKRRDGQ